MMIAVFVEIREGALKKSSLEALSEAARLAGPGGEVTAVLAGPGAADLAGGTFGFGASGAVCLEGPALAAYSAQAYAAALTGWIKESGPELVLFSATAMGNDLAPRTAALLDVGLASDCTGVRPAADGFEFLRPVFGGKVILTLAMNRRPAMASLRPKMFAPEERPAAAGAVARRNVAMPENEVKGRVVGLEREPGTALDVAEADIVVSGGRGMKSAENFALLEELAALLPKAAVGASRSAVDSGWIGHQHQVGQTGKTVAPNLYLAFGISGAIQHLAGMASSKIIVAVNKDPEAAIFKIADYGIVGDLFEVIPALKEELKKNAAG